MMGSGKSTIGKRLARELEYDLVDIDAIIEQHAGMSISDLFARHGEEAFRRLESAVLADTANRIKLVFATGGGILDNDENREVILNSGLVVWLKADAATLTARVGSGENRPMLHGHNAYDRISQLLEDRTPYYEQAHLVIEIKDRPRAEIVNEIITYYHGWLTLDEN